MFQYTAILFRFMMKLLKDLLHNGHPVFENDVVCFSIFSISYLYFEQKSRFSYSCSFANALEATGYTCLQLKYGQLLEPKR